tara:strand:+ start:741 stop:1268 length:528 start_codon:yes stop_codon:yes gene_type:complete
VNLHSSFVQFAGDKGANQASAQAVNPHGPSSPLWLSKVPAPQARAFLYGEEIMNIRRNQPDMSILTQYQEAFESGDKEQLDALIHDDCKFYPHVAGAVMTKSDITAFAGMGAVRSEARRVLFENDEVGVTHSIAHFANGSTSEAVLAFFRFKDGKIIHVETGATPLSDDYKLIGQ